MEFIYIHFWRGAVGKVWVSGLDLSKVKVLSFSEPQLTEL